MIDYQHDGGRLIRGREVHAQADGQRYLVILAATNIRRERTGVHAQVTIVINGVTLAYSNFNVEKDEERVRLANSTFKTYRENGLAPDYPATFLKKDLDDFCYGLWDEQLKELMPESVGGTEPAPPTFLLEPYIVEGGGTILFAPPGRGKSWTALLMAVAIDAGVKTSIWQVRRAKVLFLNLERSRRSFLGRLGAVNVALGLPRDRPLDILNARGRSLSEVYGACERWVAGHATECTVMDSLSRAGLGDLTANEVGNRAIDLLNALTPTWFAPAHPPRADATHVFGSQMFDAGADVIVRVLSQQADTGPLGIGLQVTKANDFRMPPLEILAYDFSPAGLTAIRRAKAAEFPEIEEGQKTDVARDIAEFILDQDGAVASATQIADALGHSRGYVARLLTTRKDRFVLVRKQGKTTLYGVVGQP